MTSLLKKLTPKEKRPTQANHRHVLNPKENWINRYVEISSHLCFRDFEKIWFDNIYLDIIRDLFDDSLDNDIILHLLSLIELMFPLFDNDEKIEETFDQLLKLSEKKRQQLSKNRKSLAIINKIYQCATSIVLYFKESSLRCDDFIQFLMYHADDEKSFYRETCLDCLQEISYCYPEMIDVSKNKILKPKNLSETYYILPLLDKQQDLETIRQIVQQLAFVSDIKFYHICTYIHRLILSGRYGDSLSLLILRPFLSRFIFSNQIHNIHFALKLLIEFGFDIFTSIEEELFLKQMVKSCTMPSLPVGYRLLLLTFIKIAFESIFKPPLNSPPLPLLNCLHPILFDGPDTQEKKLLILNQSSFVTDDEFFSILINLQKKSSSEYRNYERTTNALFHIMNQVIKKRLQLTERILQLLLDSFFNTPYIHYIKKFCLFWNEHKELGQKLTDNFIAKLMILAKDHDNRTSENSFKNLSSPTISSYKVYSLYLNFINWFLSVAHRNIRLTEFQLEFLINFIYRNSLHYTESSTLALQCCTSILYYQRVTPKVKGTLLTLLEWLKNERKTDLEASSLAQIYLLALRTLAEESIKQVFTSDEEEFLLYQTPEIFEQYLSNVKNSSKECPVLVKRVPTTDITVEKQKYGSLLTKILQFQVSLNSKSKFDRIFCVEIEFSTMQNKNGFSKIFQIAHIEVNKQPLKINLPIDLLIEDAIQIVITVKFVDFKGNIYNHHQYKHEIVTFEDLLIPLELESQIDLQSALEVIKEDTLKHCHSLQTVICCSQHNSLKTFLDEQDWLKKFLLLQQSMDNQIDFLIGLCPDRIILGTIKLINGFINIWIITNHFGIIPLLFFKFKGNIKQKC